MEKFKEFFKAKGAGFYIALSGAALLLITAVIYSVTFSISDHINLNFEVGVLLVSLLGVIAYAGLSVFKVTQEFAAAALFLCAFIAFMIFNQTSYIYLSAVFFEVGSAEEIATAFASMEFGYVFCMVAYVAVWVLSTVGIFTAVNKSDKKAEEETDEKITVCE